LYILSNFSVKERCRQGFAHSGGEDKGAILCQGDHQQNIESPFVAKEFVRKIRPHGLVLLIVFVGINSLYVSSSKGEWDFLGFFGLRSGPSPLKRSYLPAKRCKMSVFFTPKKWPVRSKLLSQSWLKYKKTH